MQELEKILEEIEQYRKAASDSGDFNVSAAYEKSMNIIRKHMNDSKCAECSRRKWYQIGYEDGKKDNDGWIPVEERLPEEKRANYEVTFINECGYEDHGFARWYDGEFHVPAVVIAWRNHLEPYRPERSVH